MIKLLRYSEAFYSVQGEGKFVGVPSVFLRCQSCNFRCMGFGLPRGEPTRKEKLEKGIKHNAEVKELIDKGVDWNRDNKAPNLEDLPILKTGCDTYASIYPEFKKFSEFKQIDGVVEHLTSLLPNNKWVQDNGQDIHFILTGGEPLLGWQRMYPDLFKHDGMKDVKNVTIETNTTQELHVDFKEFLEKQNQFHLTFSCSPKLSISGEEWDEAIKPEIAKSYYDIPNSDMYFKFVVSDEIDIDEAEKAVNLYRDAGIECPVYLMPVGGREEEYNLNYKTVSEICMERGWRFTPRLHISLFGNKWGT